MRQPTKPIVITALNARAAQTIPTMPYVLATSLALSASLMSLSWIIPALWG